MIEEMMKEDLPNLVDERRFRRREPDNVERDEFGRVCFDSTIIVLHC
jgi:homoaconitase